MSAARVLPARPSLNSLRKQARRLARDAAAGNGDAIARVHAELPRAELPLTNRDAQFVVAREYGFAGWSALLDEVHRRVGNGLEWAASQARAAIQNEDHAQLRALLTAHPALVSWHDERDQTLLDATTSYAMDCSDPERERTYTRPVAAELLIDAGAKAEHHTWMHVIKTGASGMLQLFARKNVLPNTLPVLAALGDDESIYAMLKESRDRAIENESPDDPAVVNRALMFACRFNHTPVALQLLERAIELNPELGTRINGWQNRNAFVDFLTQQSDLLWQESETTLWETFVILQLARARDENDLATFRRLLDEEPWILEPKFIPVQSRLLLPACYQKDRESFINVLFERDAALLHADAPPQSIHVVQALSYGNAHLVPLLTRVWPLPNDLPHAAGVGDKDAVARWFDETGKPVLGSLADHYPHSDPQFPRADLHWGVPSIQQVLDIALAWSVLNRHFGIAEFLLERGANINTDWATHEPASILHEAAIQGNAEAVHFLVDHGADLSITDYRYHSTAEGWARYGANDSQMADLLAAAAERVRQ